MGLWRHDAIPTQTKLGEPAVFELTARVKYKAVRADRRPVALHHLPYRFPCHSFDGLRRAEALGDIQTTPGSVASCRVDRPPPQRPRAFVSHIPTVDRSLAHL